ncbi:hypothetical protein [Paenibacillus swuensis]|uniref:hypothetical protein n=1 Tax=Paenibacillus swuensis TaxID=1178515 RepID=UPI000A9FDD98|nr:hypothetical protein [Paenibacillus swuensis]
MSERLLPILALASGISLIFLHDTWMSPFEKAFNIFCIIFSLSAGIYGLWKSREL